MTVARSTAANNSIVPRVAHLEKEMGEVRKTLAAISETLHGIARSQAEIRASAPGSWQDQLQSINHMAWLFALVAGGIIWISGTVNTKPAAELRERLAVIEYRLSGDRVAPQPSKNMSYIIQPIRM